MKINNFYEVRKLDYNWAPVRLIDVQNDTKTIEVLKNNKQIILADAYFREISISKIHLERIGFENDKFNDVYVLPIYMILGEDLMNLTSAYFGHIVFHKDEIVEIQKKYNSVRLEAYETHKTNPEIIYKTDNSMIKELNSIFNVNQLFERLEKYNIVIENKAEILMG